MRFVHLILVFGFFLPGLAVAQSFELACPPLPSPDSELYAKRDDWRCEGRFADIKFAENGFYHLAALIQGAPIAVPAKGSLVLTWPVIGSSAGSIHAFPLVEHQKPVWQMDGRIDLGQGSVAWPADFARRFKFKEEDLGLLAAATVRLGKYNRHVLLPVWSAKAETPGSSLKLALWSHANLNFVWMSLRSLDNSGQPGSGPWTDKKIVTPPRPLGVQERLWVELPLLPAPGFYELEIAVESESSGTDTTLYYFYNPGAKRKR